MEPRTPHLPLDVLYEDNHLLVVNKPPLLPTMGVAPNRPSLLILAKQYLKQKYQKPGNVYLGIVSRLDAPVTGVVVIARTSKAAARLTRQFQQNEVQKWYLAVVQGEPEPAAGQYCDWVRKDERHRRMHVTQAQHPDAKLARLDYTVCKRLGKLSLLAIRLETGRKHQIRLQLAHRGHCVVGDRKYGSKIPFAAGIALHAWRLVLTHPVRHVPMTFSATLPAAWNRWKIPTDPHLPW